MSSEVPNPFDRFTKVDAAADEITPTPDGDAVATAEAEKTKETETKPTEALKPEEKPARTEEDWIRMEAEITALKDLFARSQREPEPEPEPAPEPAPAPPSADEVQRQFTQARQTFVTGLQNHYGKQYIKQLTDRLADEGEIVPVIAEIAYDVAMTNMALLADAIERRFKDIQDGYGKTAKEVAETTFREGTTERDWEQITYDGLNDLDRRLFDKFPQIREFVEQHPPERQKRFYDVVRSLADEMAGEYTDAEDKAYENRSELARDLFYNRMEPEIDEFISKVGQEFLDMHGIQSKPAEAPAAGPNGGTPSPGRPRGPKGAGESPSGRTGRGAPEKETATQRAMREMGMRG